MLLPIYTFGQRVLKAETAQIDKDYPDLETLISNMWETMYNASGVGLAAPQVGKSIRLFMIDTLQLISEDMDSKYKITGVKQVFINPTVIETSGIAWAYEEGCLSIPGLRGEVTRDETVTIEYLNEKFEPATETYDGVDARVILHEYDHLEGILFTEKLKALKRNLIRKKLDNMRRGKVAADYPIRPNTSK